MSRALSIKMKILFSQLDCDYLLRKDHVVSIVSLSKIDTKYLLIYRNVKVKKKVSAVKLQACFLRHYPVSLNTVKDLRLEIFDLFIV